MSNFGKFAKYYDLVHQDKDYCTEASYIQKFINHLNPEAKTILDFGCGTGSYTLALHRMAFDVIGVDRSAEMIEIAKAKVYSGEDGPLFFCEKMENYQNQFKFDAIVCLFFSFCYQTTDELILKSLNCFASHLKKGGILIFDFWNKSGVLAQQPELKVQRYHSDDLEITKIAEPTLVSNMDCVDIQYTFYAENQKEEIYKFKELHKVRYMNPDFLVRCLEKFNFKVEILQGWMTNKSLEERDWSGVIVATLA